MIPRSAKANLFAFVAIALLTRISLVRAQSTPLPAEVVLVLDRCDALVAHKALVEQLRIELLALGVERVEFAESEAEIEDRAAYRGAVLSVRFAECSSVAERLELRVAAPRTAQSIERTLAIDDIPPTVRPRTVALTGAELLRSSWPALEQEGALTVERTASAQRRDGQARGAVEPDTGLPREPNRQLLSPEQQARWQHGRIDWTAASRLYPRGASGDFSTTVTSSSALNQRLRLLVSGLVAGGGVNDSKVDLQTFEAGGRIGLGIAGGSDPELEFAPSFELAYARARSPETGHTPGLLAIGLFQATLRTQVTVGLDALIGVLGGFVIAPLKVSHGGQDLGGISGPMLGVSAGLSGILLERRSH